MARRAIATEPSRYRGGPSVDGTAFVPVAPCLPDAAGNPVDPATNQVCEPLSTFKNHFAYELTKYKTIPDFIHESARMFYDVHTLGQYP